VQEGNVQEWGGAERSGEKIRNLRKIVMIFFLAATAGGRWAVASAIAQEP
jgi:hypothetical protein